MGVHSTGLCVSSRSASSNCFGTPDAHSTRVLVLRSRVKDAWDRRRGALVWRRHLQQARRVPARTVSDTDSGAGCGVGPDCLRGARRGCMCDQALSARAIGRKPGDARCVSCHRFPLAATAPEVKGFIVEGGISTSPEFVALLLGLTVTAAFIAEIVRGAILALPRGQWEASAALGMSRGRTYRDVVMPQVFRVVLPAFGNQYISLARQRRWASRLDTRTCSTSTGRWQINRVVAWKA